MRSRVRAAGASFFPPEIPSLADEPPKGSGWIHEIKHDGYRTQLAIAGGEVRAFSRNGFDWTGKYPGICAAAAKLRCRSALLDGEVAIQDEHGRTDFEGLARAIAFAPHRLIFFAFDLLHLDGESLVDVPLQERRARLRKLLRPDPRSPLQFSEAFEGDAAALFAEAERLELEGIVSKRAESRYRSGRSKTWLKVKCTVESPFVVLGMEIDRKGIAVAILGRAGKDGLAYAGGAMVALAAAQREAFHRRLRELACDRPAFGFLRKRNAQWVRPELEVKVRHLRGGDGLRHGVVKGIAN